MSLSRLVRPALGAALLVLGLAACSATRLDGTWLRPGFVDAPIEGPVFVVGVARDDTVRHVYEDEMVKNLGARGVTAMCSYQTVPGGLDKDATDRLMAAARSAGARYLLSTALIGQEVEQVIAQDSMAYGGPYRGWYGSYWGSSYPGYTELRTYSVYIAQTALTDVSADRIEWTARTRTTAPANVESDTRAFVGVIIDALADAGLVGPTR